MKKILVLLLAATLCVQPVCQAGLWSWIKTGLFTATGGTVGVAGLCAAARYLPEHVSEPTKSIIAWSPFVLSSALSLTMSLLFNRGSIINHALATVGAPVVFYSIYQVILNSRSTND